MKCPRCGSEMIIDDHRKYAIPMCYECGYMEGRSFEKIQGKSNFARLKALNLNEAAVFISKGFNLPEETVACFLEEVSAF